MNQIIHLSKAKLLNTLPINDFCGNNKQKRNIAVLFVVVIVYMAINIGAFSVTTTMNLIHAGLVEYVYASLLSLTSVALITLLLFTLNALLFEGNDYDMLQSLPVSKRDIIASKLLIVYIHCVLFHLWNDVARYGGTCTYYTCILTTLHSVLSLLCLFR